MFSFNDQGLWTIKSKTILSRSIMKLDFYNPNVSVSNYMKGVKWIGRHFSISLADKKNSMRIYTTVLCFTKFNTDFRNHLINYYKSLTDNKPFQTELLTIDEKFSNTLPFIVKKYSHSSNSFSSLLHDSTDQIFDLKGPFGLGLEINEKTTGNIVIICCGTGILPFVDFLDYLLKKSIYNILNKLFGKEAAEKGNPFKENYNASFGERINVKLFAAFKDQEEFEYLNFLQTLYEINLKYGLKYFNMCLRFGDSSQMPGIPTTFSYFDKQFLLKNLKANEVDRIFICGNHTMNISLAKICKELNIGADKIMIV